MRNSQRLHELKVALAKGIIAAPMLSVDSTAIFSDIIGNRQACFGARRLMGRDLCSEHVLSTEQVRQLGLQYDLSFTGNRCSFLRLSALLRRDPITYSLFTAGALPYPASCSKELVAYLGTLQSCYVVWIINTFYGLKTSGTNSEALTLRCGHDLSSSDYWLRSVLGRNRFDDIRCCECGRHILSEEEEGRQAEYVIALRGPTLPPADIAQVSLARFLALPTDKNKRTRPLFAAMPFFELNASFIGYYQSRRSERFHEACVEGNRDRVLHIMRSGVDVNLRNEYGQTGLFIAMWLDQQETAEVLLASGADDTIPDSAGRAPAWPRQLFALPPVLLQGNVVALIELNSYVLDGFFPNSFIDDLVDNFTSLPVAPADKASCSSRSYFCDAFQRFLPTINGALAAARVKAPGVCAAVLPHFRYLHYEHVGGHLPAHVDLCRSDFSGRPSTHTFIMYLTDVQGGETQLLRRFPRPHLPPAEFIRDHEEAVIESVQPRRGRIFVFPHQTVHCGQPIRSGKKLLLRGEAY